MSVSSPHLQRRGVYTASPHNARKSVIRLLPSTVAIYFGVSDCPLAAILPPGSECKVVRMDSGLNQTFSCLDALMK